MPKKGKVPPQLRGHQFKKGHGKKSGPKKALPAFLKKKRAGKK